jgi:hypothetical protein
VIGGISSYVFLPDRYPAYITADQYHANQAV